ncbi:uroporphyrinogen decarboxylase family protein [Cupriavidus numazuensis]|uniref:Uroporphyrinogen decarboxylase (URO-D) domain-containing protein n=1 Tax=Cupriavidus numazuensis TaxID=221992 RepID=A0ABM8TFC1_9BURK|nr:uroporphyrinogen decarboxylase family protein [Cupriavidus numazuensis]CAG2141439.1 hypothetical protein LMG26411_02056 [Cupriavidus numazuensis]
MKPMDHWRRLEATLRGESSDCVPVALWRHFPVDDMDAGKLTALTLAWQRKWQFDLLKFMPPGTYGVEDWGAKTAYAGAANGARVVTDPVVRRTEDWEKIRWIDPRSGAYGQQNIALGQTARSLGGTVPILQTVFSPLTTARKLATERLFADIRCHPAALHAALRIITDVTIDFCIEALSVGAHGIFFATQLASHRLLTTVEYEQFGKQYDLEILDAIRGRCRVNMLHAHGDDIMFDLLSDYPVELFNWHDRLTDPDLSRARRHFPGVLVGGLNEHHTLLHGGRDAIADEVQDAVVQTDGRKLIIGPGCVLPVETSDASIQAVLDAARNMEAQAA